MPKQELNKNLNQMDKQLFKENLLKTIEEIIIASGEKSPTTYTFEVVIDPEITKNHNSADDWMRLAVLNNYNIPNKIRELDEVINLLTYPKQHFPLWVNVSVKEYSNDTIIFKIESSSRFRKPSQLQNKETNYPPFKAIVS
ncbi:hypothetical protein GCM10022423_21660 [Flavobacterium ginsengiterrae]|uniref:Uncharacterized protein n=2 Tax=Flavobacterium ginsengiterrae TaxID=871695 RepID=A0ABP7GP23_9FLAO